MKSSKQILGAICTCPPTNPTDRQQAQQTHPNLFNIHSYQASTIHFHIRRNISTALSACTESKANFMDWLDSLHTHGQTSYAPFYSPHAISRQRETKRSISHSGLSVEKLNRWEDEKFVGQSCPPILRNTFVVDWGDGIVPPPAIGVMIVQIPRSPKINLNFWYVTSNVVFSRGWCVGSLISSRGNRIVALEFSFSFIATCQAVL